MKKVIRIPLVVAWLFAAGAAAATEAGADLQLRGQYTQGGLLFGQTLPGSAVHLDDESVLVSASGRFVLGFDRDANASYQLTLRLPDGQVQRRTLPIAPREYAVQRIDGLPPAQVTPPPEVLARIADDGAQVRRARRRSDPRDDFAGGFVWPVIGPVSGVYGSQRVLNGEPRRPHYGVDVARPTGTPVVAPADGVVTLAHADMYFSGGTLIVDHGHQLSSTFLHLSHIDVSPGQTVRQGQKIAEIGATGRVTGPHLDWRMNWKSARVDPQLLVPPMPPPPTPPAGDD